MASTPSASALSAVLRCRGNIWSRNPPTKRPATSAYSLGLAGGSVRNAPAESAAWAAFLLGERAVEGRRPAVVFRSPRVDGEVQIGKKSREIINNNKVGQCHPKLAQPSEDSAAPAVQNALVRQMAHRATCNLPGLDKCSQIIHMVKCQCMHATPICRVVFVQGMSESTVLRVSKKCSQNAGHTPWFVLSGWSTLRSTFLSLTALVSELMLLKLVVMCISSSPDDATHNLLSQQEEEHTKKDALQANGQIHSPTDLISGSGQKVTGDRPD